MRGWSLAGRFLLILGLAVRCAPAAPAPPPRLTEIVVLMEGLEGDLGPFDTAAAGVRAFQASEGVTVSLLPLGEDLVAWATEVPRAAREPDHRLLILGMEGPARLGLEQARVFPGKRFVLLGLPAGSDLPPNALSLAVDPFEMGWQAGYLAGTIARRLSPGPLGILAGPGMAAALAGIRCGAQRAGWDPSAVRVEAVASAWDPVAGFEAALRLYGQGAWVVVGAAGESTAGLLEAAAAVRRYAAGVGFDGAARAARIRSPAAAYWLGAAVPDVAEAVRRVLRQARRGGLTHGLAFGRADRLGVRWVATEAFQRLAPSDLQRALAEGDLPPAACP